MATIQTFKEFQPFRFGTLPSDFRTIPRVFNHFGGEEPYMQGETDLKGRWDGRVITVSAGSGLKFFIYAENVPKYVTFIKANGDIIKGKCRPDGTLYE